MQEYEKQDIEKEHGLLEPKASWRQRQTYLKTMMKLNQEALEHGAMMPVEPQEWALSLLRWSSVTDWPDPIGYAQWVRNVAMAGAMGKEDYLSQLEHEMKHNARGYARRANAPDQRPGAANA
jgi:hypothetical protein